MHFIPEQIELLWIIPVVAFGFFIFLVQYLAQKKEDRTDLSKEVAQFNTGSHSFPPSGDEQGEDRLNQLERAISSVTDSLSAQQRTIEQFNTSSSTHKNEVNELKNRLRELYKEYDIILSENYSLKAKVKKLQGHPSAGKEDAEKPSDPTAGSHVPHPSLLSKVDIKLYEDTRTLNISSLDDIPEIDLSDLMPPHA